MHFSIGMNPPVSSFHEQEQKECLAGHAAEGGFGKRPRKRGLSALPLLGLWSQFKGMYLGSSAPPSPTPSGTQASGTQRPCPKTLPSQCFLRAQSCPYTPQEPPSGFLIKDCRAFWANCLSNLGLSKQKQKRQQALFWRKGRWMDIKRSP